MLSLVSAARLQLEQENQSGAGRATRAAGSHVTTEINDDQRHLVNVRRLWEQPIYSSHDLIPSRPVLPRAASMSTLSINTRDTLTLCTVLGSTQLQFGSFYLGLKPGWHIAIQLKPCSFVAKTSRF